MRDSYDLTYINCQICCHDDCKKIYESNFDTGPVFGKVSIVNVICNFCGFIYQNPRFSASSLSYFYSHSDISSGATFRSDLPGSRQDTLIKERLHYIEGSVKHVSHEKPSLIIDVGCSTGNLLASVNIPDFEKLGIEPSRSAAQTASNSGINVINDFFENVHLSDNTADIITLISILEHATDINIILDKSKILLKPGGILIVEVPDSLKPTVQISDYFSFEHLSHFTIHTLTSFFAKHGFDVLDIDTNLSVPALRVCAGPKENIELQQSNVRAELHTTEKVIDNYKEQRNIFVASTIKIISTHIENWEKEKLVIGIFGAGMHSHLLFNYLDLSTIVKHIFDNDPNKHGKYFLNFEILHPSMMDKLKLDVIIISSRDFQDEIYDQISPVCAKRKTSILRLY